jgi:hypothetical protein
MECGECNVCCDIPYIEELNKAAHTLCSFYDAGCTIHDSKPNACAEFRCAYHQMAKASVKMRPDNCGVMFEKLEDDLMVGTVVPKHKDFKFVQGQIGAFLKENINVILYKNGQPTVYHLDTVKPERLLERIYKMKNNGSSNI